jgi:hypothetical protein
MSPRSSYQTKQKLASMQSDTLIMVPAYEFLNREQKYNVIANVV